MAIDRVDALSSKAGNIAPAAQEFVEQPALSRFWHYIAVLVIGLAAGGALGWWRVARQHAQPFMRLTVDLGSGMTVAGQGIHLALSPDGTRLVVSVRGADGMIRLATRLLNQSQFVPLSGTEDAGSPFFSPDGQWIAFFANGKLRKIPVQGGTPVTLSEASTFQGPIARFPSGSWGDDGKSSRCSTRPSD